MKKILSIAFSVMLFAVQVFGQPVPQPSATVKIKSSGSTQGTVDTIDFGSGSAASVSGHTASVSVTGGSGNVVGPASATDGHVTMFDGTTGKIIKDSGITLSGSNTGDQDLSGLVPKTTTVNGHALSGNVSVTTTDLSLNNLTNDKQVKGLSGGTTAGHLMTWGVDGYTPADGGAVPTGASGANPTATIGLSAVNGSASTFLRSDGAPPLSQSITPTWTGLHKFTDADFSLLGSSTGYTILHSGLSGSSNNNITLPTTATDTLAGLGTTQTFTAANWFNNNSTVLGSASSTSLDTLTVQTSSGGVTVNSTGVTVTNNITQSTNNDREAIGTNGSSAEQYDGEYLTFTRSATITGGIIGWGTRNGSPTGTVTVTLQTVSGGYPTGTLAHANATTTITPVDNSNVSFSWTPFTVSAGNYALVVRSTNAQSTGNWFGVGIYDGGGQPWSKLKKNVGGSWSSPSADMTFVLNKSDSANSPTYTFSSAGSTTAQIYTDGANSDALTMKVNGSTAATISSTGAMTANVSIASPTVNATTAHQTNGVAGVSGTGTTSCLCKTFSGGICTSLGTCA